MKRLLPFLAVLAVSLASDSNPNLNELCEGILFATVPHPNDQRLFIGCIQGKGTLFGCTLADQIFDSRLVECVRNDFVVNQPQKELCKEKVSGHFPHQDDCALYIVCQSSQAEVRECPDNRIFNVHVPACVSGDRIACDLFNHTTPAPLDPTTTLPTDDTSTQTQPSTINPNDVVIQFVCPIEGFGNIPHQSDCKRYFECIRGFRYPSTCPDDLIFDVITSSCREPESSVCANIIRCG